MDRNPRILPPGARTATPTGANWGAILSLLFALLYGASPIDLIPDIIPILGWTDDVVVVLMAIGIAWKFVKARRMKSA